MNLLFTDEDEEEIRSSYWNIKKDDVVIDVGCFMGSYTIPALEAGATVYAIDPYISHTGALCQIAKEIDKLVVITATLSEEGGYSSEFLAILTAVLQNTMFAPLDSVKYLTLDALVTQYKITKLNWIKIDVEGAELSVLRGGIKTLSRFKPQMIIEDHTGIYKFVEELDIRQQCLELLLSLDYTVELVPYIGHKTPDRTFLICS